VSEEEFRDLLKRSIRLEVTSECDEAEGKYIRVALVSREANSSFAPPTIMEEWVYLPT
jgi:hypothetical protein